MSSDKNLAYTWVRNPFQLHVANHNIQVIFTNFFLLIVLQMITMVLLLLQVVARETPVQDVNQYNFTPLAGVQNSEPLSISIFLN